MSWAASKAYEEQLKKDAIADYNTTEAQVEILAIDQGTNTEEKVIERKQYKGATPSTPTMTKDRMEYAMARAKRRENREKLADMRSDFVELAKAFGIANTENISMFKVPSNVNTEEWDKAKQKLGLEF